MFSLSDGMTGTVDISRTRKECVEEFPLPACSVEEGERSVFEAATASLGEESCEGGVE